MLIVMLALAAAQVEAPDTVVTPDPVICKRAPAATGTRFQPPPVCRPQSEWDEEARATRQQLQKIHDRSISPTPIPGGPTPPGG